MSRSRYIQVIHLPGRRNGEELVAGIHTVMSELGRLLSSRVPLNPPTHQ